MSEIEHRPRAPDRASSREITFTSPYAPVKGMPRKITHERSLGHRRSSQSEELTTKVERASPQRGPGPAPVEPPDRASSREIISTSPDAPADGMP